jgi:protein-S-isoprenylcysteine O-methyltransferase Ste14
MSERTSASHETTPQVRRALARWAVRTAAGVVVYGAFIFLSAGTLGWVWGWVFLALLTAVMIAHPLVLVPANPEVLVEREKGLWNQGVKAWDKWITTLAGGLMPLPWIVAGLDLRWHWSALLPLAVHLGGLLVAVLGYALFLWAMASNAFFSQGVRIQAERGHAVAAGGPYQVVRHPGYAGTILTQLAAPCLLGSPWALIPAGLSAALFVVRTRLEDKMLLAELSGYPDYARRTPARLLPGVW